MIEHRTLSLAEQVLERLEGEILSGKYQRGELLSEMRLVTDLGVSRTPVREALHRLEQEHLIEISPKGILIVGVTQKDLEDIFAIRLRIEGLAAKEAALNMTDEQIRELLETVELQEFYVTRHDADHIKGLDSKFHRLLYKFSGSATLTILPEYGHNDGIDAVYRDTDVIDWLIHAKREDFTPVTETLAHKF